MLNLALLSYLKVTLPLILAYISEKKGKEINKGPKNSKQTKNAETKQTNKSQQRQQGQGYAIKALTEGGEGGRCEGFVGINRSTCDLLR